MPETQRITRRSLLRAGGLVLVAPLAPGLAGPAVAAEPAVFARRGVALGGTDPVSYFDGDGPAAGLAEFTHVWNDAEWRFASAEARDRFAAAPEQYAPQYGGYCAWAVANGYTASTVPEAWHITDGRLYLNYSLSVRQRWRGDIPGHIRRGDANWPGVLD